MAMTGIGGNERTFQSLNDAAGWLRLVDSVVGFSRRGIWAS